MGGCCSRCFTLIYKRRIIREYTALDTQSSGLDSTTGLFDDDSDGDGLIGSLSGHSSSQAPPAVTENEKLLLSSKNYAAIIGSQQRFDQEIDKQLAEQEEKLRREESEKINRVRNKNNHLAARSQAMEDPFSSNNSSEWNVAGGVDDTDMLFDSLTTRSRRQNPDLGDDTEITEDDFVNGFTPDT